jgi:hypothetical protein
MVLQQPPRGHRAVDEESDVPGERTGGGDAGLFAQLGQPCLTALRVPHGDGPGLRVQIRFDRRADERAAEEAVPVEGVRERVEQCDESLARAAPPSSSSAVITPFQLDDSANAPCTSTIVGLAEVVVVMLMACSSSSGPTCAEPVPAPGRSHP